MSAIISRLWGPCMLTKEDKKDIRHLIKVMLFVWLFLLGLAALTIWLSYVGIYPNIPWLGIFFMALMGFLAVLFTIYMAVTLAFSIKETKLFASKNYDEALKLALFMAKISIGKDRQVYYGDVAAVYLYKNDLEQVKIYLGKVSNPVYLDIFSPERIAVLINDGHLSEAKRVYLDYAIKHRNGKTCVERNNVLFLDAIFSHLAGNDLRPEEQEAVNKNHVPFFDDLLSK